MIGKIQAKMVYFKEKQKLQKSGFTIIGIVSSISFSIFLFTLLEYFQIADFSIPGKLNYTLLRISAILNFYFIYMLISGALLKLETYVSDSSLRFRMFPFISKFREFDKDAIHSFEIFNDKKLKEYGGWNIRRKYGRMKNIFIVHGSKAIKIYLTDGQKIILGTQKPNLFAKGLERMKQFK